MINGPDRRETLFAGLAAGAFWMLPAMARAAEGGVDTGEAEAFSFDAVVDLARELASSSYAPPRIAEAEILDEIGYDLHNRISYRDDRTLWGDGEDAAPVRLFHPGRFFKEPVRIHMVENGEAREILFASDYFDMDEDHPARQLTEAGFAGFRVMDEEQSRDWMAFLGASYFRTSGPFDQFGLSARGIAVDTAAAGPEEFPRFSRFWLEPDGNHGLVAYALLEGPRITGAYRIASRREDGVIQDVEAALFLRGDIERLGIAPLTSMFWYGKNNRDAARDWRPEIHDSDGLAIWTGGGERIWRPLNNPPQVVVNSFSDNNPRGFGLMQRERDFEQYQDDGVFYEKRASLWVEPLDPWGEGSVQLVEIPTDDEIHDNIGAFWVPGEPANAGTEHRLRYRLHWIAEEPEEPETSCVVATRTGMGGVPGQPRPEGTIKFAVDFDGRGFEGLDRESAVEPVITASRGEIDGAVAYPVVGTERWRVLFDLTVDGEGPIDLRMYVAHDGNAMTETWIYQVFPSQVA